jgi:hypothetical protein
MSDPNVFRRFATERFKRVNSLTSPLFDMAVFLTLAIVFAIGLCTFKLAFNLAALYFYIFIPNSLTVLARKAIDNLINERKQTKARVMLLTIAASLLLGGLLGYFVLSKVSLFLDFVCIGGLSPILISCVMLSVYHLEDLLKKTKLGFIPFLVIYFCILIIPFSSAVVPLMLDVVFASAVSVAFVASLIAKQALRFYHYYNYGHTNADGYEINRSKIEQEQFMEQQAQNFYVNTNAFKALVEECRKKIIQAKSRPNNFDAAFHVTKKEAANSFKDIYFALMRDTTSTTTSTSTSTNYYVITALLRQSRQSVIAERFLKRTSRLRTEITHRKLSDDLVYRHFDVDLYTEDYHQPNIFPGLPDRLIEPFLSY